MAGYTTDKNRLLLSMDNEHMQSQIAYNVYQTFTHSKGSCNSTIIVIYCQTPPWLYTPYLLVQTLLG